jgi:heme exporter protein D
MPGNNFSYLWVAVVLTGMAILINYWHLITSKKEPMVPNEEDTIL